MSLMPLAIARNSYSMRLVHPFVRLLRRYPAIPAAALDDLEQRDLDERVPIQLVHELLSAAIQVTGDEDIGLKAARELGMGALGALEYAASSARTIRDATAVIARYMHLLNDGLDILVETQGDRVAVCLHNAFVLPAAAEDFALAAFHVSVKERFHEIDVDYEVCFQHAAPRSIDEYLKTFPRGTLRFGSELSGFLFAAGTLDQELPTQDPQLHSVIRRHADYLLADLPRVETFTQRVRDRVVKELDAGETSAPRIAKLLGVSQRTLNRKLEMEGTSYKTLLDEVRRGMALRYTTGSDLLLSEISTRLGFSHAAAFNRAFKRWTGKAPLEYRRQHGR
jgi:AraC-like DNA-binding protein